VAIFLEWDKSWCDGTLRQFVTDRWKQTEKQHLDKI